MGEERMRRGAIALVSILIALLFVQPASAAKSVSIGSFSDSEGDLGHPVFIVDEDGNLFPASYWPETSPVGDSGYLDMLWGEIRLGQNGILTANLTVLEPVTDGTVLPNSVTEVWWTWMFYKPGYEWWYDYAYAVYLCWDGSTLECLVMQNGLEEPVGLAKSYSVVDDEIVVSFDAGLITEACYWFVAVICWEYWNPYMELGLLPMSPVSSWYAADIIDCKGNPLPLELPD